MVDHLVDLGGVEDLRGIAVGDGKLRIGAMTRQRELEQSPEIARYCPLMAEALRHVGHRQTRNRGTIGGSLAHADPAAELPAICAAYDAIIHLASVRGIRAVPFREFTAGFMATALAARRNDCRHRAADLAAGPRLRLSRICAPSRRFCAGRRRRAARCRRRQCRAAARRLRCAASPLRRSGSTPPKRGSSASRSTPALDPFRGGRGVAGRAGFRYSRQRRLSAASGAGFERARAHRCRAARRRRSSARRVMDCAESV